MTNTIKKTIAAILVLATLLCVCACSASDDKTVRVYNWGDYIDDTVIAQFEEETGYKVIYEKFDTNETMYAKIANGNSNYDVLVPSDYMIQRLISEDMLQKIDFANVPNFANIGDDYKGISYDPNDEYSVPYMWGTLGILYNKTMVDEEVDSWEMLWNEKYKGKIFMLDSSRDSICAALSLLGYSINTTDEEELEEAKQKLIDQIPLVGGYLVDDIKDKMIGGEGALCIAWAGDAEYCMSQNEDLEYIIPKEGSNIFFDSMCIPKTAKNKAGAEAFINFMCKPEISAKNAEYIGYSTPIPAARELMGEKGHSEAAYPDVSKYQLEIFSDAGDANRLYDQIWTEVLASIDE